MNQKSKSKSNFSIENILSAAINLPFSLDELSTPAEPPVSEPPVSEPLVLEPPVLEPPVLEPPVSAPVVVSPQPIVSFGLPIPIVPGYYPFLPALPAPQAFFHQYAIQQRALNSAVRADIVQRNQPTSNVEGFDDKNQSTSNIELGSVNQNSRFISIQDFDQTGNLSFELIYRQNIYNIYMGVM